mmetsp:Transcript_5703/g.3285  ORF Transcript_5703/g.3285 Transcript_5703/m.3285 type:complete len:81 (+) Transcript_5703:105-347(+)
MGRVYLHGVMDVAILATIMMIGNKASEFSNGLMAGDMKACGIMASNMDKALIYLTMGSEGRGSGKKAEGSSGIIALEMMM